MSQQIVDSFITELSSTVENYQSQTDAAPELAPLVDMSVHMINALGALRSELANEDDS